MRNSWWMAPAAVLLVLGGVVAGLFMGRRPLGANVGQTSRQVSVPGKSPAAGATKPNVDKPVVDKPASNGPPTAGQPATGADQPPPPAAEQRPADHVANDFLLAFMQARMSGDAPKVASMLAPGAVSGAVRVSGPGMRMTGYSYELLGSGDPDAFVFRARTAFAGPQPGGEVSVEQIRLTWKGGLKVAAFGQAAKESLALSAGSDGLLYLSRGQETAAVADLAALPEQFQPFGADAGVQFGAGREGWSVAATSMTGSHVLWVTRGLHPLLGVSQVAWGGAPAVTPLDLLFEAGVAEAAWAPGPARYVAVAVTEPSGNTGLVIWDISARKRFGPDLGGSPSGGAYQVQNLRWLSPSLVAFDANVGGAVSGPWTYNINSRTLASP